MNVNTVADIPINILFTRPARTCKSLHTLIRYTRRGLLIPVLALVTLVGHALISSISLASTFSAPSYVAPLLDLPRFIFLGDTTTPHRYEPMGLARRSFRKPRNFA